jgi:hypothetical protein
MKYYPILPILFCLVMAACNRQTGNEDSGTATPATESEETSYVKSNTVSTPREPSKVSFAEEKAEARPAARRQVKPASVKAPAKSKEKTTPETIYVETYGAQGKVWGHVTMNGERGTGTIHDYDENTLSVTVTRHGDELFAVDQNSRQYVFKLKQNKTQE